MSRPLRVIEPGLLHHVMNRGGGGKEIFEDDQDRESFFDLVAEVATRWNVCTSAACLMSNHYHLLLWDEAGHLSRAMRHIDGVYTQRFNRRHGVDGSLMRGRFRSRVVQQEVYLFEVMRYIHANPVRAGLVERAGDYPWSSHRHYLSGDAPPWLQPTLLEEQFAGGDDFIVWLERFVHESVDPTLDNAVSGLRWSPILGDQAFVEAMRKIVRRDPSAPTDAVPERRRLSMLTVEEVLASACGVFEIDRDDLVTGMRGRANPRRLLALLACRDHTAADARALAEVFGVKPATLSVLAMKARALRQNEPKVEASWKTLMKAIDASR